MAFPDCDNFASTITWLYKCLNILGGKDSTYLWNKIFRGEVFLVMMKMLTNDVVAENQRTMSFHNLNQKTIYNWGPIDILFK